MNSFRPKKNLHFAFWFWFVGTMSTGHATAVLPDSQPVITSLTIQGTNLVFSANFPAEVEAAVLEWRPTLTAAWQQAAPLDVPTNGGDLEFTLPQPALDMAFFRLNVTLRTTAQAEQSGEVQYVAVPSLVKITTNDTPPAEAVFHFRGQIDGSDRIVITHHGAYWEHVNWGWPAGTVTVNGSQWNPSEKNFLTTTGAVEFLPEMYSLAAANLEVIEGRDVIALERTNNALIVYLDDTPSGAAPYEFKIHFHQVAARPVAFHASPTGTLKIAANIDGSDRLKITANDATWTHLAYSLPEAVTVNGIPWDIRQTNVLHNTGTNAFLPAGVDFSTARITHREGRDLATLWADDEALWVTFADNPNGQDAYELEISFGNEPDAHDSQNKQQ